MSLEAALLDALLAETGDVVLVAGVDGRVERASPAYTRLTGLTAEQVHGRLLWELVGDPESGPAPGPRVLAGNDRWEGTSWLRDTDDQPHPVRLVLRRVLDPAGGHERIVAVLHSSELAREEGTGEEAGYRDALTGLPGRTLFTDLVGQSLAGARREGRSVGLVLLGLDGFATINDGLGVAYGDAALRSMAERLSNSIRRSDIIGRAGGDVFALATPLTADDHAVIVAQKILEAVNEPLPAEDTEVRLDASVGVSVFPVDAEDTETMMRHADSALRHAKRQGGARYQFYGADMNQRARQRLAVEQGLRRALARDELMVYYQPKVDVETDRIVGMEALIRWHDPEHGMVPPGEFIPVAEETGLIKDLGNWILRAAAAQNRAWQGAGLAPAVVSVNVSPRQFRDPGFPDAVADALAASGLDPAWLELEITESMTMGDADNAVARMRALRDLGVRLSIDDFGTGYSNLGYLARFPVTTLKIDRSFVRDVQTDPGMAEIARAIIGLSRSLNLEIVAEGAETVDHIAFLRDHGCPTVQGFYYSKPLPAESFRQVLAAGTIGPAEAP